MKDGNLRLAGGLTCCNGFAQKRIHLFENMKNIFWRVSIRVDLPLHRSS